MAERLAIAQPPLSRAIQRLERRLGVLLLASHRQRCRPDRARDGPAAVGSRGPRRGGSRRAPNSPGGGRSAGCGAGDRYVRI
ncbi:helix-turn-helix domain-containing protein [Enemella evansiae]|uniref:helix-turn-helix domain-containing protein n=1 Tax=Enemella evansiae TaxID=2016499 RepID=UPI00398329C7